MPSQSQNQKELSRKNLLVTRGTAVGSPVATKPGVGADVSLWAWRSHPRTKGEEGVLGKSFGSRPATSQSVRMVQMQGEGSGRLWALQGVPKVLFSFKAKEEECGLFLLGTPHFLPHQSISLGKTVTDSERRKMQLPSMPLNAWH